MLPVVDDARLEAPDGHAAWSEAFHELFAQVAGGFENSAVRGHGRWYLLGLLSPASCETLRAATCERSESQRAVDKIAGDWTCCCGA